MTELSTWSVAFDATVHDGRGREPGEDEDDLLNALEELGADGPVAGGGDVGYLSARFCVDAPDPIIALALGSEVMAKAIAIAGVPAGDPFRAEVILFDDMVAEQEGRKIEGGPHLPTYVGVSEIAELLGLSRQRVYQILNAPRSRFPQPAAQLSRGALWNRDDVERWAERDRPSGRPKAAASA